MVPGAEDRLAAFDASTIEWREHPRFPNVFIKPLLTSETHPLASVSLVRVPPGSTISRHCHAKEIETVYVLAGQSVLTVGEMDMPFGAGQIVAIPAGVEHALQNEGTAPVELLIFFTPPLN